MKKALVLGGFMILLVLPVTAGAAIINGGFEYDFFGWSKHGRTAVVESATLLDGTGGSVAFEPFAGEKMGAIAYPKMKGWLWNNWISQEVRLEPGDKFLVFAYNFWTYDERPFDNPGFAVEINGQTVFSLAAADVGADNVLGTLDFTGWTQIAIPVSQYQSPSRPTTLMVAFKAGNTGDHLFQSGVFLDDVRFVVPIPTTALLLGSGLMGLIGLRRKIRGSL